MTEKTIMDTNLKTAETVQKSAEQFVKTAWSIMNAAAEKQQASQYLSEKGIKAIQDKHLRRKQ
jgi:hypothetical protein